MEEKLQRLMDAIRYLKGQGIINKHQDIAQKMEYDKSTISNIVNGRYKVSDDFIDKFCELFPELNIDWLKTGAGEMLKNVKMKERLIEFLKTINLGQRKFEENCGLSNGFVDKVGDAIREKNLQKISNVYPELDIDWLKTGAGEMLKNNQSIGDVSNSTVVGANVNGNGNQITNNEEKTIVGMIDLQKGYQELLKQKDEQLNRLIGIIEKFNEKG